MNEHMPQEVLLAINTGLLALVGFFLKSLFGRFEKLEMEVKASMVNTAVEGQRIFQIEKDLGELKQIVMSSLFSKKLEK
jgi:hypothetical protein